ncbi:MAG: chorismate mutase [Chloroflexi bacterium]|nr:chorismate mutase [Chloroflexota bacterium]
MPLMCRGVRGAVTVPANTREDILRETRRLLALMIHLNGIEAEDVASAILTTTPDLNAEFPALAARQLGWWDVPLLCGHEMSVPHQMPRVVRILVHWNTTKTQKEIIHVYLGEAAKLRPDQIHLQTVDWDDLEAWIATQLAAFQRRKEQEK